MNLTSEQLLFTSALDVRSRFVRLISLLFQAAESAAPSKRRIIRSLANNVRKQLETYIEAIAQASEGANAIMATRGENEWASSAREQLANAAFKGYEGFRQQHDEAYTYISGNVSVPNDLLHFLFRALDLSLVSRTHRQSVALYPSRHLMWESSSSKDKDAPAVVAAILVPYSETASPMRWPLLVHELAHHLSPGGVSSDALRQAVLDAFDKNADSATNIRSEALKDGLSELQADSIAEDAIGVTYAIAMAREAYLIISNRHFENGGPSIRQRLEHLEHGSDVSRALPGEWHLDEERILVGGQKGVSVATPTVDEMAELARLGEELRKLRNRSTLSDKTERARVLIKAGDPIPSIPRLGTPSQEEFEKVARGEHTDQSIKDLFLSVADIPLTDSEILEAAWLDELDTPIEKILTSLLAPASGEEFEDEKARLDAADVRLSRSLQAAAVHQWLITHDSKIREAIATPESLPASSIADGSTGSTADQKQETPAQPLTESSPLSDVQLARRLTLPPSHTRRLVVRPLVDPGQVGGTTIDLRLGTEWETLRTSRFRGLDPSDDPAEVTDLLNESVEEFRLTAGESQGMVLHPGELLLALTLEYLALPNDLWGQLEGRSTWARLGLQVHATAGMVDAGFKGFLTLELQNTGRLPIVLYPGLRVGQMAFFPVRDIVRPYGAKTGAAYSNQAKARSAFTQQHEHLARYEYIQSELNKEAARQSRLSSE